MRRAIKYIDLFCGIGGFRIGFEQACSIHNLKAECVLSSDIDSNCRLSYANNFGETPLGDIHEIQSSGIEDFDVLLGGFPCQPFSIIGKRQGFEDQRGNLFFEIARILRDKRPKAFILENVKQLISHDKGRTLNVILTTLSELGYKTKFACLNALDYGLPQKRERILIVGHIYHNLDFQFPPKIESYTPLSEILEDNPSQKLFASDKIRNSRLTTHKSEYSPAIWHENKSGNVSSKPYSCALRAGASYNYLLVDGIRRLSSRELLRLQGFPDTYQPLASDFQVRKQTGNAVPVNLVRETAKALLSTIKDVLD
jgi:DNA (cytosine-5)-methyltransferase 1